MHSLHTRISFLLFLDLSVHYKMHKDEKNQLNKLKFTMHAC